MGNEAAKGGGQLPVLAGGCGARMVSMPPPVTRASPSRTSAYLTSRAQSSFISESAKVYPAGARGSAAASRRSGLQQGDLFDELGHATRPLEQGPVSDAFEHDFTHLAAR